MNEEAAELMTEEEWAAHEADEALERARLYRMADGNIMAEIPGPMVLRWWAVAPTRKKAKAQLRMVIMHNLIAACTE